MEWFKKAQVQYDRSYDSIANMKVVGDTVEAAVEAEWEDAEDFRQQHYTQETGYALGDVGGEIDLAGKVYVQEGTDSPELYLKEVMEEDPPMSVVKIVEDATSPVSWKEVGPKVDVQVTKLDPIDIGLYDTAVRVSISGGYRYKPADYA
jgi:hypothetical protein